MSDGGYIKLYRKVWDSEIFNDGERFTRLTAWMWLLTHANYKDTTVVIRGNAYKIQRGQVMVSVRYLAEIWHWNPRTVMHYLQQLECTDMVTRTRTSYATLITIRNYSKYQGSSDWENGEYNAQYNTQYNSEYNAQCNNYKNSKEIYKNSKEKNTRACARDGQVIE